VYCHPLGLRHWAKQMLPKSEAKRQKRIVLRGGIVSFLRDVLCIFTTMRRIADALDRLHPPKFVDARHKRDGELYRARTLKSDK
jgi:hypothetical protein